MVLTVAGMHQDHRPPLLHAGSPATHGPTNAFRVVPAVLPNVAVMRGAGTALTQFAQTSGAHAPPPSPRPNVSVAASGRSPALSPSLSRTAPSAFPSPSASPRPRPPPTPPYRAYSDNQDRADSRGFHYAEGRQLPQRTNGGPQADPGTRVFADSRVAAGGSTSPRVADADRRGGRYLVGPEYSAPGGPMERRYLDAAWGVTPSTKRSLGLAD